MGAPERQAGISGIEGDGMGAGGAYGSLTRTLEDLEARLTRLSAAQRPAGGIETTPIAPAPVRSEGSTTARLRSVIEQRLAGSSRVALEAAGVEEKAEAAGARKRLGGAALDRRLGTIAGEVESLRLQGATLQLVSGIADDLEVLKAEVADNIATRSEVGFNEIRDSFEELRAAIVVNDETGAVNRQAAAILERLGRMQADGLDRAALDELRADMERVLLVVAETAREETTASERRWDAFEERLEAHIELDGTAKRDLRAELERLRQSVRLLATAEQVAAVESRWDEFEATYFDRLRRENEEQLGRFMRTELDALGARIEALAEANAVSDIDARLARMEKADAGNDTAERLSRLAARFDQLEEALVSLPDLLGVDRLEQRLQALAESVAIVSERQLDPEIEHFLVLEERLDEISQAIVASALREEPAIDMAPVERIEARVAELAARVERLAAQGDTERLTDRVAELSARIEELAARPQAEPIGLHVEALSAKVDAALARIERPHAEAAALELRLAALAARLEEASQTRVDDEVVRSLEAQITRLGSQLAEGSADAMAESGTEIHRRLDAIEQRIDDSRTEVMAAARSAADEAVRLMLKDGERRESEHVQQLSEDLRSLEALCRETDERSVKVFEAVHTTLVKIADRLLTIETEVRSDAARENRRADAYPFAMPEMDAIAASASGGFDPFDPIDPVDPVAITEEAPAPRGLRAAITRHLGSRSARPERSAVEALARAVPREARTELGEVAPIDAADAIVMREVNRPLEPGSGAPDIATLLERVRLQQRAEAETQEPLVKADFIAAARKAALAAAAEADTLRRENEDDFDDADAPRGFGRHRKPILMAVGAVLLAMMAIPLGRGHLPEGLGSSLLQTAGFGSGQTIEGSIATAGTPEVILEAAPIETAAIAAPTPAPSDIVPAETPAAADEAAPVVSGIADELADAVEAIPSETFEASIASLAASRAGSGAGAGIDPIETASLSHPASMPALTPAPIVSDAPAAPAAPVEVAAQIREPADPVMERALAKLPEGARSISEAAPEGIGPQALIEAAGTRNAMAIFEVGLRLMEGRGGAPRPDEALAWFARSAELGYAPAQYSLGTLFEKGNGVTRDAEAARDWYTLAARHGNIRAMHNLAVLYATGVDGHAEPVTAAHWFTEAAEHGMRDSQYNLGILHARGAGVEQNLGQSYKWFSIVGASGDADAAEKRDEVKKALSPEEIAGIDADVAAWKPRQRLEAANTVDLPDDWTEAGEQTASADMSRAIRNVQAILTKLGFDAGTPDGIVGTRTTEAVRAFQEKNGLDATGTIDEALIRELLARNV